MIKKVLYAITALACAGLVVVYGLSIKDAKLEAQATTIRTPIAQTLDATDVTQTSAILHGTYNNNAGYGGHVWFEYGLTSNGSGWANTNKVGVHGISGTGLVNESFTLTNLLSNKNYYYRIIAENGDGRAQGDIKNFKTQSLGNSACDPDPKRDLSYTLDYRVEGWTTASSVIKNNSTVCTYKVGMASYKVYGPNQIANQTLWDSHTKTIGPGESASFTVTLPSCISQVDVFDGDVLLPPFYSLDRLIAGPWVNFNLGYCGNTVDSATLKLVKTVTNDNGGTKQIADFKLYQNGVEVTSGQDKTYTFAQSGDSTLVTATETNLANYTAGSWGGDCAADGKITLHPGDHKTCTINNNDNPPVVIQPATLKLVKTVVNNNGGTKTVGDFKLYMNDVAVNSGEQKTFTFASSNETKTITVSELNLPGYNAGAWSGSCTATTYPAGDVNHDGTVNQTDMNLLSTAYNTQTGDAKYNANADFNNDGKVDFSDLVVIAQNFGTSTVTTGALADRGDVDHNGTIDKTDMDLLSVAYGTQTGNAKFNANADFNKDGKVDFSDLVRLAQNFNGNDIIVTGKVTLRPGDNLTCTITNDDIAPGSASLTLVKTVTNDNGGTKQVSDFKLYQNGIEVTSGQAKTYTFTNINDSILITATETNLANYTAGSWTGGCASDGKITLRPGDNKTCSINNNDNPQTVLKGCLAVKKKAYTAGDNRISPTPAFTFKFDGTNYTTNSNGDLTISNIPVGNHILEEVVPSGWTLTSVVPTLTNNTVAIGAGSGCMEVTFSNKQVAPPTLAATCTASKNPVLLNETVTYTAIPTGGNGTFTYAWSGTGGLSGNAVSTSTSYSTTGTKTAQVVVASGSQSITAECNTVVNDPPAGTFALTCTAVASQGNYANLPVVFTANPTGGTGVYTYSWSGPNINSNQKSFSTSFGSPGVYTGTVHVTSGTETLSAQCPAVINVPPSTCAGCGGGGNPPTVTVTSAPGQVAGVFLSQVPYTGVGSNLRIALFMIALFTWSAWVSYLIIKRKAKKNGVTVSEIFNGPTSPTFAFAGSSTQSPMHNGFAAIQEKIRGSIPVIPTIPRADINAIPHEPKSSEPKNSVKSPFIDVPTDNTYEKLFPTKTSHPVKDNTTLMPQVAKPKAEMTLPSSTEDVLETLEMKARELSTLISADGLEIIAKASGNNKHNATIILHHLVELYKGTEQEIDGDWMVLNGEKINKILFSTYITMTPVFVQWLTAGDDRKTMSFVRMLQMQGQTVKDFVMNIVIELDKAYRYRVENHGDADAAILDATMQWSNQELESVIHTLVTAVDQTYSSIYASVKIALVKVLDMSKSKLYQ